MTQWNLKPAVIAAGAVLLASLPAFAFDEPLAIESSGENCSFKSIPEDFVSSQSRAHSELFERVRRIADRRSEKGRRTIPANEVARRNFIDDEIFGRLEQENVPAAALSTDEEFLRRVSLDLTGRIPSAHDIREFIASTNPGKRDEWIDKLIDSPEFVDKWSVWMGDLVQLNQARLSTSGFSIEFDGRNAFYNYLRGSIASGKSIRDMAYEMVTARGNNYAADMGQLNFAVSSHAAGGPAVDTYDMMMYRSSAAFLGLAHYDCLACHSGRGHTNLVSSWATKVTRTQAWGMSAFFSRTRLQRNHSNAALRYTSPLYNSTEIVDVATGEYLLNVTNGNRPPRCYNGLPVDPSTNRCPPNPTAQSIRVTPEYRDGQKPSGGNWREAFGQFMVDDPMFSRNFANRLWKAMFNLALAEPVDQLDPDRLDPDNPPAAPWSFQASHPELLQKLAHHFVDYNYSLRETLRLIAKSSAYQLSSRYEGDWGPAQVPLFARHYPRRIDGEEVHDAIAKATGISGRYNVQATIARASATTPVTMLPDPVIWAMQLPDTGEPRTNRQVNEFMNFFLRGNRDTQSRSQAGSILQQLALMNDPFVNNRTRLTASPVLTAISGMPSHEAMVEELFLAFVSRQPSEAERTVALSLLGRAADQNARNIAVEDLAWALINKVDFLFSY